MYGSPSMWKFNQGTWSFFLQMGLLANLHSLIYENQRLSVIRDKVLNHDIGWTNRGTEPTTLNGPPLVQMQRFHQLGDWRLSPRWKRLVRVLGGGNAPSKRAKRSTDRAHAKCRTFLIGENEREVESVNGASKQLPKTFGFCLPICRKGMAFLMIRFCTYPFLHFPSYSSTLLESCRFCCEGLPHF